MYDLTVDADKSLRVRVCDMEISEIGIVSDGDGHSDVVLRIHGGAISLSNPRKVWISEDLPTFHVCLYKSGQVIKLTIR